MFTHYFLILNILNSINKFAVAHTQQAPNWSILLDYKGLQILNFSINKRATNHYGDLHSVLLSWNFPYDDAVNQTDTKRGSSVVCAAKLFHKTFLLHKAWLKHEMSSFVFVYKETIVHTNIPVFTLNI